MLELDALHRTGDRLDAKLRAKLRWVAADANRCGYAKAAAEADLRRAGATAAELEALVGNHAGLTDSERAALAFAHKLTADAASVTDDEVNRLIRLAGDRQVVAMVALIAHACFQDRILLALDPPSRQAVRRRRWPPSSRAPGPRPGPRRSRSPRPPRKVGGPWRSRTRLGVPRASTTCKRS
jgi:alkylhydroperoxidase family enzyme